MTTTLTLSQQGDCDNFDHNRRKYECVRYQKHIDIERTPENTTLRTCSPQEAYKKLFSGSVEKYNQYQIDHGHPERVIDDYYKQIQEDKKKHAGYEFWFQLGSTKEPAEIAPEVFDEIVRRFVSKVSELYGSNVCIYGAYIHRDEDGEQHAHLDVIYHGHSKRKSMEVESSMSLALAELGYKGNKKYTPQMQFQEDLRTLAIRILRDFGIYVEESKEHHKGHYSKEEYFEHEEKKAKKKARALEKEKRGHVKSYNDEDDWCGPS